MNAPGGSTAVIHPRNIARAASTSGRSRRCLVLQSDGLESLPTVEAEEPAPRTLLLRVRGELDMANVAELHTVLDDELGEGEFSWIVVDLSRVTLVDTAALRTLQDLRRRCRLQNMQLVLVGTANPAVHRPLRLTGLLPLFDTRPTVQAALRGHTSSSPGTAARLRVGQLASRIDAR
jgi:anti-anti-sigma factor